MTDTKMKSVPKVRFESFTDDWEERKLGDIVVFLNGRAYKQAELLDSGKYPVLRVGNFNTNDKWYYSDLELPAKNYADKGDLLYTWATAFGPHIWKGPKVIYHYHIWKVETTSDISKNFAVHLLDADQAQMTNSLNGSTMVHITKGTMENKIVTIPGISEQRNMARLLDQLDCTIALHQRKHDSLLKLKQAYLQKMFPKNGQKTPELRFGGFTDDWEERKLIDIAGNLSDGDWIEANHIFDNGKYRIVQTGNIGIGSFLDKLQHAKYFHQADFDELKANEIFPGDILISRLSDPAGRTAIFPDLGVRAVTSVDVAIIRPADNFNSDFLVSELNSSTILAQVDSLASGSTRKRISRKNLEGVKISIPTVEEQRKIGSFFEQLDKTIDLHQQQLDNLKQLKKWALQNLFV